MKRGHKYNAVKTEIDGIIFPSKLEAACYAEIAQALRVGAIKRFETQVTLRLPSGTKLVVDFMVRMNDDSIKYIEAKGMETPVFRLKKREIEHHFAPIKITVCKTAKQCAGAIYAQMDI